MNKPADILEAEARGFARGIEAAAQRLEKYDNPSHPGSTWIRVYTKAIRALQDREVPHDR